MHADLSIGRQEDFEVWAEGEVGMHCEPPQELAQGFLPLFQEFLAHVVKVPRNLLAW